MHYKEDRMKLFKVVVRVENVIELRVQAESESEARKKAEALALTSSPASPKVVDASLALLYETPFQVGSKVKHQLFGVGTITEMTPATSGGGEQGWRTEIEFEDKAHGVKGMYLGAGRPHLELLNA